MTDFLFPAAMLAALLAASVLRARSRLPLAMLAVAGDEDMKIVGDSFAPRPAEDPAETEARLFLEEKESGNVERARQLGRLFAEDILSVVNHSPLGDKANRSQMEARHQLLLCAFLVNRVIDEYSPNSILAQTSLQVFNDTIEESSEALFQHISDPAAFSLYTLWERSRDRSEDELGQIYARLCGLEEDPRVIGDGNRLSAWFYESCVKKIKAIDYVDVD